MIVNKKFKLEESLLIAKTSESSRFFRDQSQHNTYVNIYLQHC